MRCQICGAELRGALCPDCGFDRSLDRERYPTLINDGRRPEAVWVLRQRLTRANADAGTRSPGPAGAPPDAGAKAPSAAPPARQQPVDPSPMPWEQPAAPAKARKRRGLPFLLTAAALVFVLAAVLLLPKGTADPTRRASTPAPATEAAPTAMPTTPTATPMPTTTPTPAPTAEELLAQGYAQSEDGLFWKLGDGVLTIRGEGRMADYTYYGNAPWFAHREAITRVTIAKGVTSIGEFAFRGCSNLSEITIPASVTSIGDCAFANCSSLSEITIPASVTSIGSEAFIYCSSLKEITIPEGVTSIGEIAFANCSSLREITIPASVTSIGIAAFSYCDSLRTIKVEKGNACFCVVDGVLFSKDEKTLICFPAAKTDTSYRIPEGVTSIGEYAFDGCSSLREITIPASVTSIGECAFDSCLSLSEITIPEGVTSIGSEAFAYCSSLKEITIPTSVTSIGEYAFASCSLTDVNFAGTRAQWEKITIGDGNELLLSAAIHYNA